MKNLLINRALAAGTKKLFILLFALVAGAGILFASDTQVNGIWYDFDSSSNSATVTYRGSSCSAYSDEYTGLVAIPASVTYNNVKYSVTRIGAYAFDGCTGLTYVTIPNSVTSIGTCAFCGCSGLTYAEIPNSVTTINSGAFRECTSMTAVPLQNSITSIGTEAFMKCTSLTSVTIPNSVTNISHYTFQSCHSLTSVTIGNGVTSIGNNAFYDCKSLTSIEIPSSVTSIGANAFQNCTGLTAVYISDIAAWCAISIENIEDNPLYYAHNLYLNYKLVTDLVIPNSVTSIGHYAFYGCYSLTSVTIPNSVTRIGAYAFEHCTGLTSVTIPSSVTSILKYAFSRCYCLTSVKIPNSVTSIRDYAFLDVPNIVYSGSASGSPWGARCVNGYVDGYLIYSDATKTTLKACSASAQGQIVIPSSVTSIGASAFDGCTGLTYVTIPNSVTSIGMYAFCDCKSLTSIEIPSSVTRIDDDIFSGCSGLTFVKIPSSVTRILWGAFDGCTKLSSIVCEATTPPTLLASIMDKLPYSGITLYVPANSVSKYKSDDKWKAFNIQPISYYTITWKNWDGTTLKTEQIIIGMTPSYTGSTPTKASTAQYTYTFSGWTPTIAKVTANATYTATFTQTLRKYTITWKNADGTTLKTEQVDYGTTPSYTGSTPTKESTAQYDYTFAGWTPAVAIVTQAATYTATYTSALREYLVTFLNEDNTVISSKNYKYGETPVAPVDPIKQNTAEYTYTFNGWDNAIAQVQGPQTYKATFIATKNSYTITWQNEDGSLIDQTIVEYGQVPAHADPIKQNTAEYTYTFSGWTPTVVAVTGNATYKATFTATKNSYTITWQDENGSLIDQTTVEYGQIPAHADPVKQNTAEYTYTFSGWTPVVAAVTGNATYRATFSATKNSYTITWQDENGSLIDQTIVEYGQIPAHAEPTKQATAEYTYTFAGWTPTVVAVTGNATYRATFSATKNKYLITFRNDDGTVLKSEEVEYGMLPIAPATPTKESTAQYNYEFAGWTPSVTLVSQAVTYTATYNSSVREYLVTFLNDDNSIISMQSCKYGSYPTIPSTPTKQATAEFSYTFAGWTPNIVAVSGDVTYKATFNATRNSYTITWQDENGALIDQTTVEYGQIPAHADPVKQNTAEYTYTFAGWTPAVVAVTGDATYKATFTATKNSYTITWQNEDGSLIDQTTVKYGVVPTHAEPTKEATEEYTYTFSGWTPAVVAVTGDATYKATFSSVVNVYTISVSAVNGQVIGGGEYQYGATIDLTAIPNEGYVFDQWSDGVKDNPRTITVTGDAEYTALFTSTEGFENIYTSEPVQKVIIDQKVYILRGEKVYTLTGQEVK